MKPYIAARITCCRIILVLVLDFTDTASALFSESDFDLEIEERATITTTPMDAAVAIPVTEFNKTVKCPKSVVS